MKLLNLPGTTAAFAPGRRCPPDPPGPLRSSVSSLCEPKSAGNQAVPDGEAPDQTAAVPVSGQTARAPGRPSMRLVVPRHGGTASRGSAGARPVPGSGCDDQL